MPQPASVAIEEGVIDVLKNVSRRPIQPTLASDLVNHDISFTGKGVTSYIINVIGNFTDPNSTHFNVDQEDALFNFEDATKVNLGQWGASILAPTYANTAP